MTGPVVHHDDEVIEIEQAMDALVKRVAVGIAEQNTLVLSALSQMTEAIKATNQQLADLLIKALEKEQIVLPAPIVTLEAAEMKIPAPIIQSPPDVIVNIPMDKPRTVKMKVTRDKNGAMAGLEGTIE